LEHSPLLIEYPLIHVSQLNKLEHFSQFCEHGLQLLLVLKYPDLHESHVALELSSNPALHCKQLLARLQKIQLEGQHLSPKLINPSLQVKHLERDPQIKQLAEQGLQFFPIAK
jgi:hypothetical protein